MVLLTAFATCYALAAVDAVASRTSAITFAAHNCFALLTSPTFVITDNASAISTPDAVPFRQRHVWAIRVVRSQQVGYDHKEVEKAALLKRVADRLPTISFANDFVLDVRVGDALVGGSRI